MMFRWLGGFCLLVLWSVALPDASAATVQSSVLAPRLTAYARVVAATTPLHTPVAGIVSSIEALPGDHVEKGALLAHLSGPDFDAMLAQRAASVRAGRGRTRSAC